MTASPSNGTSPTPSTRPRRSGVVVPHEPTWVQRLLARMLYSLMWLLNATLRYRWNDQSGHYETKTSEPAIYCAWHNRLSIGLFAYFAYARPRHPTPGIAALVSASKDGGFLSEVLRCFQVQPVRGSSSRRGPQALRELTTWAEKGYDLAITPDGPRGPRYVVQQGVMAMAQLTGLPIIPFSYYLHWKIRLRSWDAFQIPLPFSVVELNAVEPIRVPRDATDAEREQLRLKLENALKELSKD